MAITRGVGPIYITLNSQASNTGTLNGTTAGRSIIAVVMWYDPSSNATPTVSVSGESNMTPVSGSKFTNLLSSISGQIFVLANNTGGGNKTITMAVGTFYAEVGVMEYAGLDTASQPDAGSVGNGSAPSSHTINLTTTTANALIVAGDANNFAPAMAGANYTVFGGAGMGTGLGYLQCEDDLDAGGAGTKAVDFSASGDWAITAASFKAAGGGAANWGRLLGMETNRLVRVVG